jgi:hypothetical protein
MENSNVKITNNHFQNIDIKIEPEGEIYTFARKICNGRNVCKGK